MEQQIKHYLKDVLENMPNDWLRLTTHRLDIYNEAKAKHEFIEGFDALYKTGNANRSDLAALPTAYDYIRLGHPLSSVLEWAIASVHGLQPEAVISFSSAMMPIMAVLRKNLLSQRDTRIIYRGALPKNFDTQTIREVYNYNFELVEVQEQSALTDHSGSTIFLCQQEDLFDISLDDSIDFYLSIHPQLGSLMLVNRDVNAAYIGEIQHVRRRESIAMTPSNCLAALQQFTSGETANTTEAVTNNKALVLKSIQEITGIDTKAVIGSSGLSVQYAVMMGLIAYAQEHYQGKEIKFIVPPNCYGGTNDQARRVASCLDHVEILDLLVDSGNNMVDSLATVLDQVAQEDAVPFIIVEIPTNPRVEVPDLNRLQDVLSKERNTKDGQIAIDPVFIIDQTFCPNFSFLADDDILSEIRTISYVSGSKFPSGGLCTAGYGLANRKGADLMDKIEKHIQLCDNEASSHQLAFLAQQMPSMIQRIADAYQNTRAFVNFIKEQLPEAKINFVSEELAAENFTPSVFSLDLPTKGETPQAREEHKRALNLKLINMMIDQAPGSKYCVSYGQLKGVYWTIPATSTQGTTKEEDKDYIARVSCSPDMDLEKHKEVFADFVSQID